MKNFQFYFISCSFGLTCVFCGKINESAENNVITNETFNNEELDTTLATNKYNLSQGYNTMAVQFKPSCVTGVNINIPQNANHAVVTFQNDQSEINLRNQLDIDLSVTIPIQGIVNLTPALQYARDAAKTQLSHTTTYVAYVELGSKTLIPTEPKILDEYMSDFDTNGNLINPTDFIHQCGDELVTSQKLSSKILITAKVNFQSQSDLNAFNLNLGVSPTVAPNWSLNVKIKDIDTNIRKRMSLSIYAIQLGGNPVQLVNSLGSTSSCTLDNFTGCQAVLDKINSYVTNVYPTQLDPKNLATWNIESITTEPYSNLRFTNQSGQLLNFKVTDGYQNLQALSELRSYMSSKIFSEMNNYYIASAMLQSNYLSTNEAVTLNSIITNSAQNIENLRIFADTCYNNILQCLTDYTSGYVNKLTTTYDTSILQTNIGKRIASVYSYINTSSDIDRRSSDNFTVLNPELQNGIYSSYYFKFKTMDNKLITNPSVSVDVMCDFGFWFPGTLLIDVFPKYEVMSNALTLNYKKYCAEQHPIYIANPSGFSPDIVGNDKMFIVELWGRN